MKTEKTSKSRGAGRTRNFACVVYPESAPEGWQTLITESKLPLFVSPLHDQDIDPQNQPKKPHYHVMVMYDSVKTLEQANAFFQSFGGVGCEVINSVRGYSRYLCHLDNPEKHQYDVDDVVSFGGADYIRAIESASDRQKLIREMMQWVHANDEICFSDLMDYASINRSDWFDALTTSSAYVIKEYIKSYAWKHRNMEEK